MDAILTWFQNLTANLQFASVYSAVLRYVFPVLAILVLGRCARSLLLFKKEPEIWAWLATPTGDRVPVTHWENLLGRSKGCDVVLDYPTISRSHAVLTRYDDGSWSISDIGSKGGISVNGTETAMSAVAFGDVISLGGVEFTLVPITKEQEVIQASVRTRAGREVKPSVTLFFLTLFQVLAAIQLMLHTDSVLAVAAAFGELIGIEWVLFFGLKIFRRSGFDVETVAFFLTTMGVSVVASSVPSELNKEIFSILAGIVLFLFIGWSLRDLERAKKIRYVAAAAGILLLMLNMVFGVEKFGAKNWVQLGPVSFQPSELVKICFIFAGASTLQRLMTRRNLILFIGYSAAICGCLALMSDFGAAIIFFVTFLVIAFLRSGDFATIALACTGTGIAGVLALKFKPYIKKRFSAWGHVWGERSHVRLPADPRHDVHCLRRSLWPGRRLRLAQICRRRRYGSRVCLRRRGMGTDYGNPDRSRRRNPGCLRRPLRTARQEQLLYDRRLRGCDDPDDAGYSQFLRHRGFFAADRRDLPVCLKRRLQHAVRLGSARLYQSG
jgi:hypothetical protein